MPKTRSRALSGATLCCALSTGAAQSGFNDRMAEDVRGQAPAVVAPAAMKSERAGRDGATGRVFGGGLATWYGPGFHGRRTASGERFNAHGMTAAHRSLPFGTRVRVVHQDTGRSVVVRINDRGPHRRGAVIDLSQGSARALGMGGVARVQIVGAEE